ncbi:hypothetical protein OIU77_009115 [Salix suchowensis]|uniref:Uncharacterized protein n=1 Tax=Salix suchowensis TaxID=1278906 RepID=A0ABQ9ADI0_9ROSI|nr:hypothetical protein OIU77_009115 [Salix suchowensis]
MITLFPLLHEHKETTNSSNSASVEIKFPLENWIHVGFEVLTDILRLHINGEIVSEQPQSSSLDKNWNYDGPRKIALVGACADDGLQGYVYRAEFLPLSRSIKDRYVKDPPLWLSIDLSSTSEIDEGNDGIWNIVGGKVAVSSLLFLPAISKNLHEKTYESNSSDHFQSICKLENNICHLELAGCCTCQPFV